MSESIESKVDNDELAILRNQVKQYEGEIMRLRGLADELSWALARSVLMQSQPKG